MNKPYIKKYSEVGGYAVWIVDGKYIRENIDREFTNFDHHWDSNCNYIPKNEFWIDKEMKEGEIQFYINHLLIEAKLMADGISKSTARDIADSIEKRERMDSDKFKKIVGAENKLSKEESVKKIKKDFLETYSKKVSVWIVDGELVRSLFLIKFTEGGHDFVYDFIPAKEIWIDDDVSPLERKFILLHELYERYLMAIKGWKSYDRAHSKASELEWFYRHHPEKIDNSLKLCAELNSQ